MACLSPERHVGICRVPHSVTIFVASHGSQTQINCLEGRRRLLEKDMYLSKFHPILKRTLIRLSERGYLVRTSASRQGVPGLNPTAAPKSYEVYPSTSGLLSFNKPETVLWTIANNYY